MVADRYNASFHRVRDVASFVVTPIEWSVSLPLDGLHAIVENFLLRQKLVADNTQLRSENLLLQSQLQKQSAIESENQQLRALLQSNEVQAGEKITQAQLLAVSTDPFIKQVILNKGASAHLFVGQPVLDAYGVMGQIVRVEPLTSRVLLLTDPRSAISVQVKRTGFRAIAVGDSMRNLLRLENVTDTADIRQGDELMTSGLGQYYPFGYPVGKVIAVEHNEAGKFADVWVSPAAQLDRSRLVLLVWPVQTMLQKSAAEKASPVVAKKRGSPQTVKSRGKK
jgi:rod shape-determining protein MreC